jgi:hypothetical protein
MKTTYLMTRLRTHTNYVTLPGFIHTFQNSLTQPPKTNNNNNNNNKVQSALENSNYKLHYDRSIITARTVHNNRPDIRVVILAKTTKETHSIDVAIPNRHNLLSTITEKLQKYTDLKEDLIRIWQL